MNERHADKHHLHRNLHVGDAVGARVVHVEFLGDVEDVGEAVRRCEDGGDLVADVDPAEDLVVVETDLLVLTVATTRRMRMVRSGGDVLGRGGGYLVASRTRWTYAVLDQAAAGLNWDGGLRSGTV